jgi:hypothetical protein
MGRKALSALGIAATAALVLASVSVAPAGAQSPLASPSTVAGGIPMGGPFVPAGTLYDNEQSNATTSLVSQDSTGAFTARTADDFTIAADPGCASNMFGITNIRTQMVQFDTVPQAFAVDLYNDNGSGTAPVSGITPFSTFPETSQALLGAFGVGTSIFEASFETPALVLSAATIYWVSGFGTNAAANAGAFNNFFAASNGATGTTDNGVIIAPGAGVADWTPIDVVIGPPPLAFAFAVDGACQVVGGGGTTLPVDPNVPTLSPLGLGLLVVLLLLASGYVLARRRRA